MLHNIRDFHQTCINRDMIRTFQFDASPGLPPVDKASSEITSSAFIRTKRNTGFRNKRDANLLLIDRQNWQKNEENFACKLQDFMLVCYLHLHAQQNKVPPRKTDIYQLPKSHNSTDSMTPKYLIELG